MVPTLPARRFATRVLPLAAAFAALVAAPATAQETPAGTPAGTPAEGSTYVVPSGPGEAVRVTTYARRPAERGRLARRYKGLRANRTAPVATPPAARVVPAAPLYRSPRAAYVRRYGSYFQVVRRR
ncbi:hypothetical protein RQM47_12220 [Rubrivirga sp. S365]|uniref:Uncharacterized protein n=1 Tax=Rubrivirga litoralis TaxID=3075598 RepID=A0ABU3BNH6_9BACT|nr:MULTISPECIES: hypothetical protein [unclassified Rubrivirga]MDT0630857.1 hypothetical protein [Rubrivirga sp. F394]MDT7857409.1 hypothetical protein [Rubrivirga sp. S365]